jgi:hypothetical protein
MPGSQQMPGGMPMPGGPQMMAGPPMMGGPPMDPHMGGAMHGFGPSMSPMPEVRHAPHRNRAENQELPEHKKEEVKRHNVHLPGGESLPSGSNKYALYGALEDLNEENIIDQQEKLARRRRINCVPALNALFLPWVLFLFVFSLASFELHYTMPAVVFFTNASIVVGALAYAYMAFTKKNVAPAKAFYPTYLAVTFLIAASFGWLLGDLNFWFFMQPAYNIEHLATYNNVNPSTMATRSGAHVPTGARGIRTRERCTSSIMPCSI